MLNSLLSKFVGIVHNNDAAAFPLPSMYHFQPNIFKRGGPSNQEMVWTRSHGVRVGKEQCDRSILNLKMEIPTLKLVWCEANPCHWALGSIELPLGLFSHSKHNQRLDDIMDAYLRKDGHSPFPSKWILRLYETNRCLLVFILGRTYVAPPPKPPRRTWILRLHETNRCLFGCYSLWGRKHLVFFRNIFV